MERKKFFSGIFCSGITGYPPGRNKIGIYLSPTQKSTPNELKT